MNLRRMEFPDERCSVGHNMKKEGLYMDAEGKPLGCYKCRLIRTRVAQRRPIRFRDQLAFGDGE